MGTAPLLAGAAVVLYTFPNLAGIGFASEFTKLASFFRLAVWLCLYACSWVVRGLGLVAS